MLYFLGSSIIVPFGSIVQSNISYTYSILQMNIASFSAVFPFVYANEWICSPAIMKFVENLCLAYVNDGYIYGYLARNILKDTSIYIVPMCNPDGVDLVTGAIPKDNNFYKEAEKIATSYPAIPFPSGWKANITGESFINFHLFVFKK